ncbi:ABC transporter substrate-binding protein [Sabulicella rubraurantiaca]|uniref:ABC transporter substrate-binding protein n=1 Tax=Sabulicella rubraurantiaca TaxID=2811429 RepID=UPI001A971E54|nr:ABC transporter substrate-binding protein [Sabulicella rubraurantiaca]
MIRRLAALALLLAVALPASAQTVRWGNNGEVSTMDPHGAFSTANAALLGNIYEGLVRHDRELRFEPALATGWEVLAPDHWRFTIRQGVRFHDGSPLTPADVVASLRRASLPNSPYASVTHMIQSVEQSGDWTVDICLRGPYPVLINDLAGISILSEAWMQRHDALQPADPARGRTAYTSMNTNGTGPYRLVSREPDAQTVLERFDGWWDRSPVPVQRVVFTPVANDATRVAGLLGGQLDVITPTPLQDLDRLRAANGLRVVEAQDLRVMFLVFNVAADHPVEGQPRNPLADARVRQALSMGVDVGAVTQSVMRGLTQPIHTLIAPEIGGYDAALATPRVAHDTAAARRLLAEAGYPEGFGIGFDCPNDRFVNGERVCRAIASMWARIGVRANLNVMRYPPYMARFLNHQSDIFLLGWANTPQLDGFSLLNNVLHTKNQRSGSWNAGRVSDPAFDAIVARAAVEMDPARRTALMTEAFTMERRAFWTLPLYREPMVVAMRRPLDMPASADGRMRFWMARLD